jgi:hypothetical protein
MRWLSLGAICIRTAEYADHGDLLQFGRKRPRQLSQASPSDAGQVILQRDTTRDIEFETATWPRFWHASEMCAFFGSRSVKRAAQSHAAGLDRKS